MYTSIGNQLFMIVHYCFSFWLLLLFLPKHMFFKRDEDRLQGYVINATAMILMIIIVGYLLIVFKLYEIVVLIGLFLAIIFRDYLFKRGTRKRKKVILSLSVAFYRLLDHRMKVKKWLAKYRSFRPTFSYKTFFSHRILLVAVLVYAAYIRFYDTFIHAAPPLSDSYVTLAWMKYASNQQLFHDGIYPQGFHIFLATLQKFAAIDPFYVLRYTGPLVSVLLVLLTYFFVSRLVHNPWAGLIAAAIHGLLGEQLLGGDYTREAATNSQEFAFLFVLPAVYFFLRYIQTGDRKWLLTGFMATTITGLVHTLVFAFVGMGMGVLLFSTLIVQFKAWKKRMLHVAAAGIGAVILSVIPLLLGLLLGKEFHSASADYLTSKAQNFSPRDLTMLDHVSLGALAVLVVACFWMRKEKSQQLTFVFLTAFSLATFLLYDYGGVVTKNLVIATRSGNLWGIVLPVCVGVGWHVLFQLLTRLKWQNAAQGVACGSLLVAIPFFATITPIEPYKMERDSSIEQYMRISSQLVPKTWMIVSQEEGYAVVLDQGFHMYMGEFVKRYDPSKVPLTQMGLQGIDRNIPPDVFVFQEKEVYRVKKTNGIYSLMEPIYNRREQENKAFNEWMNRYKQHDHRVDQVYEDDQMRVYRFQVKQKVNEGEEQARLWKNQFR